MWNQIFYWLRGISACVAGILTYIYGTFDNLLLILILACVADYATGIIKACITHKLSSNVGFVGILRKVLIFVVVGLASVIDRYTGAGFALRNLVIVFYFANECLSIIENCGEMGVPLPKFLVNMLESMKKNADDGKGDVEDGSKDELSDI